MKWKKWKRLIAAMLCVLMLGSELSVAAAEVTEELVTEASAEAETAPEAETPGTPEAEVSTETGMVPETEPTDELIEEITEETEAVQAQAPEQASEAEVSEETAGSFWLSVSTVSKNIIEPAAVSYTAGQTIKEALKASGYDFEGIDAGYISAVEGTAGSFSLYFSDGDYQLDRAASEITAVIFTENTTAGYCAEAISLVEALGTFNGRTDGVKQYAEAKAAYTEALTALRTGTAAQMAAAQAELQTAVEKYESIFADENKVQVTVTVTQGTETLESPVVTFTDIYGNQTEVTGTSLSVVPGEYTFTVSDGGYNYTTGTITVEQASEGAAASAAELKAELPSGEWFGNIVLYDTEKEAFSYEQDSETHTAEYFIPDTNALSESVYLYVQKGSDLPVDANGTAAAKLFACYYDERFDRDMGTDLNYRSWESTNTSLTGFVQQGMEGKVVPLEARYTDANGYVMTQFYTLTITRVPTLASLEILDAQGSSLLAEFASDTTDYTVSVTGGFLEFQAKTFGMEGYTVELSTENGTLDGEHEVILTETETTVVVKVSHTNGQSRSYTLQITKKDPAKVSLSVEEGVTAALYNAGGSKMIPLEDQTYELIPGETYTYIATKNTAYHASASFVAEDRQTIAVVSPLVETALKDLAVYNASNKNSREAFPVSDAFSASLYSYTYQVPDANTAAYFQATPADGYSAYARYAGRSLNQGSSLEGKAYNTLLKYEVSTTESAQSLTALLVKGGYTGSLTVRAEKTAAVNGTDVTYYQDYEITLQRKLHLQSLEVTQAGSTFTLLDSEGEVISFDRDVLDYYVDIPSDTTELTIAAHFMNEGDPLESTWNGGYFALAEGTEKTAISELTISLDSSKETETFTIEVCHTDTAAEKTTYRVHAQKVEPVTITFSVNPSDAIFFLKSNLDQKTIYGEEKDGIWTYHLFPGQSYTYHVTCSGYQGVRVTDYKAPAQDAAVSVTLQAAPKNTKLQEVEAQWPTFLANENNNNVVDAPIPTKDEETVLYWAAKLGEAAGSTTPSQPILAGDYLYCHGGSSLYKIDTLTGEVKESGSMDRASSFAINPPTYAEGMIFVGLANGGVQAFDANTLESLWIYNDDLKGQPNCTLTYRDGYLYTSFWQGETMDANFVCLSVTDEDPTQTMEEKIPSWTYKQSGGFYWAGAYVSDEFLLVGTDDGESGYERGYAHLLSLDPKSGAVLDDLALPHTGDLRSSICYDAEGTKDYYFTTKGGYFYRISVNKDGTFKENSLKWVELENGTSVQPMSTSTPTVYKGRAYVGVSGSSQFGAYSGHNISVIDLASMTIAYRVPTQGYPQTTGLLTTAYENSEGKVYVYFSDNMTPGKVRMISDKPGRTAPAEVTKETYTSSGQEVTVDTAYVLWTPAGAQKQYALATPIVDSYGTMYIKNDSGYIMALGSTIEKLEVTQQPEKKAYNIGEIFDASGMQVIAAYSNGKTRDVTELVTYSQEPLTTDDTEIILTYETVLYQNKDGQEGVEYTAPVATISISVTDINDIIRMIGEIGTPVTLASEAAITAARAAYDPLPEEMKEQVTNYTVLKEAEKALAQLKKQITAVIANIDSIGEVTLESEAQILAAEKAYAKLTEEQKTYITNYETLTKAREVLDVLKEAASTALESLALVCSGITETEEGGKVLTQVRPYDEATQQHTSVEVEPSVKGSPSSALVLWDGLVWYLDGEVTASNRFVFDAAGTHVISVSYGDVTDSLRVEVTDAEIPEETDYVRDGVTRTYFKNVEPDLTFADIKEDLEEALLVTNDGADAAADGSLAEETGRLVFTDAKGKEIVETTKLSKLLESKTELTINVQYWLEAADAADGEGAEDRLVDSAEMTLIYDKLLLKEMQLEAGATTLAGAGVTGTRFFNTAVLKPVLSCHGSILEELPAGMTLHVSAAPKKKNVLIFDEETGTVTGAAAGTSDLTVQVTIDWSTGDENGTTKTFSLGSKKLTFTVLGAREVKSIAITNLEDGSYRIGVEDVKTAAKQQPLTLSILDYAEEAYGDAALTWKTSNKKIAYVTVDKTGAATLVIPKGASGVAEITVTAKDTAKQSTSFKVIVFDTDVRLDTTSLTLNSYGEEPGVIYLYPNILGCGEEVKIAVKAVKNAGTKKAPDYVEDSAYVLAYDQASGMLSVQFADAKTKAGTYTLTLEITQSLENEETWTVYKTVKIKNKPVTPKTSAAATAITLTGVDTIIYPELGEQEVQVCLQVPEAIRDEVASPRKLALTAKAAKLFAITDVEALEETADQILVTLRTKELSSIKPGKSAELAFTVTSDTFAKAVTTKSLKVTAKKLSGVKTTFENTADGSKAASYTFQQAQADRESLNLLPILSEDHLSYYTSYAAADTKTAEALNGGKLVVKRVTITDEDGEERETFVIKATPELYDVKGLSKCKLKFTCYAASEEGDGIYRKLSAATLTVTLKKQKTAAAVTASVKVKGSLNVVDPDSEVSITPTFKNLPLGAKLYSVDFADSADKAYYDLQRETTLRTGVVTLVRDADTKPLPIGKDSVELVYRYRQTDGSLGKVTVKASINVVQTAAVKADQKSLTLYNAAIGEAYGKTVAFTVSKAGNAKIAGVDITGLENSGISWQFREDGQVKFYVDGEQSRGIEKTYKAKVIVTLEHAGTKKGSVVTYSVPVSVVLKK